MGCQIIPSFNALVFLVLLAPAALSSSRNDQFHENKGSDRHYTFSAGSYSASIRRQINAIVYIPGNNKGIPPSTKETQYSTDTFSTCKNVVPRQIFSNNTDVLTTERTESVTVLTEHGENGLRTDMGTTTESGGAIPSLPNAPDTPTETAPTPSHGLNTPTESTPWDAAPIPSGNPSAATRQFNGDTTPTLRHEQSTSANPEVPAPSDTSNHSDDSTNSVGSSPNEVTTTTLEDPTIIRSPLRDISAASIDGGTTTGRLPSETESIRHENSGTLDSQSRSGTSISPSNSNALAPVKADENSSSAGTRGSEATTFDSFSTFTGLESAEAASVPHDTPIITTEFVVSSVPTPVDHSSPSHTAESDVSAPLSENNSPTGTRETEVAIFDSFSTPTGLKPSKVTSVPHSSPATTTELVVSSVPTPVDQSGPSHAMTKNNVASTPPGENSSPTGSRGSEATTFGSFRTPTGSTPSDATPVQPGNPTISTKLLSDLSIPLRSTLNKAPSEERGSTAPTGLAPPSSISIPSDGSGVSIAATGSGEASTPPVGSGSPARSRQSTSVPSGRNTPTDQTPSDTSTPSDNSASSAPNESTSQSDGSKTSTRPTRSSTGSKSSRNSNNPTRSVDNQPSNQTPGVTYCTVAQGGSAVVYAMVQTTTFVAGNAAAIAIPHLFYIAMAAGVIAHAQFF